MDWGEWEWIGGGVEGLRERELFGRVGGRVWGGLVCSLILGVSCCWTLICLERISVWAYLYRAAEWVVALRLVYGYLGQKNCDAVVREDIAGSRDQAQLPVEYDRMQPIMYGFGDPRLTRLRPM